MGGVHGVALLVDGEVSGEVALGAVELGGARGLVDDLLELREQARLRLFELLRRRRDVDAEEPRCSYSSKKGLSELKK